MILTYLPYKVVLAALGHYRHPSIEVAISVRSRMGSYPILVVNLKNTSAMQVVNINGYFSTTESKC